MLGLRTFGPFTSIPLIFKIELYVGLRDLQPLRLVILSYIFKISITLIFKFEMDFCDPGPLSPSPSEIVDIFYISIKISFRC